MKDCQGAQEFLKKLEELYLELGKYLQEKYAIGKKLLQRLLIHVLESILGHMTIFRNYINILSYSFTKEKMAIKG